MRGMLRMFGDAFGEAEKYAATFPMTTSRGLLTKDHFIASQRWPTASGRRPRRVRLEKSSKRAANLHLRSRPSGDTQAPGIATALIVELRRIAALPRRPRHLRPGRLRRRSRHQPLQQNSGIAKT